MDGVRYQHISCRPRAVSRHIDGGLLGRMRDASVGVSWSVRGQTSEY